MPAIQAFVDKKVTCGACFRAKSVGPRLAEPGSLARKADPARHSGAHMLIGGSFPVIRYRLQGSYTEFE
jgi:hypothetical protein